MSRNKRPANGNGTQSILRHWQEAVPNDRLAHLVRDTGRALMRSLQTRLAQHAVSFGHWAFLRILWETDGLTQRQLSDRAGVMEPTTFTAIKAMEKRGYILRAQMPGNKRKIYIHLTPKGRLLKSKLVPLAEEVNAVAIGAVKPADVATARRTLLAMLENLARDELESSGKQRRIPLTRALSRTAADASRNRAKSRRRA